MIEERVGDLLKQNDVKMFIHQVNCQGVMNSGIAKQIRDEYPENFLEYRRMVDTFMESDMKLLGNVLIHFDEGKHIYIANMFSQDYYGYDGQQYTDYEAFDKCLFDIMDTIKSSNIDTVGLPYGIGCVRGGASWERIYSIIEKYFADSDIKCVICKLQEENNDEKYKINQ